MDERHRRHLVLIGMMASGKTTVGRRVAALADRPFVDNDDELTEREGASARAILDEHGPEALHRLEADVLHQALDAATPSVITAAAATVLDPGVRERLRDEATVVWLRARPEVLAGRAAGDQPRPWLAEVESPEDRLAAMAAERVPLYREVADLVLDVDDLTPDAAASLVLGFLLPA